jgi:hypothetical protein
MSIQSLVQGIVGQVMAGSLSARGAGGIETEADWYYPCRFCKGRTPVWCEGTKPEYACWCGTYICPLCAVLTPALTTVEHMRGKAGVDVLCPHCPMCLLDEEECGVQERKDEG